jgi:hypothetical protein
VVRQLVSQPAGEGLIVEMNPAKGFKCDFVCVRMRQDVRRPLSCFVSISLEGKRSVFEVKSEKLGMFCFTCWLIDHEHRECGTSVFEDKDLTFGE